MNIPSLTPAQIAVVPALTGANIDNELADIMAGYWADPLGHVMFSYPWSTGPLVGFDGPDEWARGFLIEWGEEIALRGFDGIHGVAPIRFSTASGHGIGKTALVSWIIKYVLDTRPGAKGVVTANTAEQLRTKTWAELAKWHNMSATRHWYKLNAGGGGSMNLYHLSNPEYWRVDAMTCREENSEAFAGLHAATSCPFFIFDEASAVPDKIYEVREGGATDGEPMSFDFGNPTRNVGKFHSNMVGRTRHRYIKRFIDSRDVAITNKELFEQWIEDYGIDSDFVKVRVRGMFPAMSMRQFISTDDVDAAFGRDLKPNQYSFAPVILGVDPAWTGEDEFVIMLRQGLMSKVLGFYEYNDDDIFMSNIIARFQDEYHASAVFVDGGYGTGIVSAGSAMGRSWQLVWFGGKSADPGCLNKRSEMWNSVRLWLKQGAAIPEDYVLYEDLVRPETVPRLDGKIVLETKEQMKARGIPSPNRADALALTFAMPVVEDEDRFNAGSIKSDFDPYGHEEAARA